MEKINKEFSLLQMKYDLTLCVCVCTPHHCTCHYREKKKLATIEDHINREKGYKFLCGSYVHKLIILLPGCLCVKGVCYLVICSTKLEIELTKLFIQMFLIVLVMVNLMCLVIIVSLMCVHCVGQSV